MENCTLRILFSMHVRGMVRMMTRYWCAFMTYVSVTCLHTAIYANTHQWHLSDISQGIHCSVQAATGQSYPKVSRFIGEDLVFDKTQRFLARNTDWLTCCIERVFNSNDDPLDGLKDGLNLLLFRKDDMTSPLRMSTLTGWRRCNFICSGDTYYNPTNTSSEPQKFWQ